MNFQDKSTSKTYKVFIDFYKINVPFIRGGLKPTAFAKLTCKSQKRRVSTLRMWDVLLFKINKNLIGLGLFLCFLIISCSENPECSPPISGEYGNHVILAYNESTKEISGIYQSEINTENDAQDSCYFYFVGKFAGEKTNMISWRIGHRLEEVFGVMTMQDSLSFDLAFEKSHINCTKNQGFSDVYTLNKKTDWRYIRTIKKDGAEVFAQPDTMPIAPFDTLLRKGTIIKVTDKKIDWVKSDGWWIREQDVIRFPG